MDDILVKGQKMEAIIEGLGFRVWGLGGPKSLAFRL